MKKLATIFIMSMMLLGGLYPLQLLRAQSDTVLEQQLELRASKISQKLRCPICQGQSIAESDAPIAQRLQLFVREELHKGKSDEEVIGEIVKRYGDFVYFKPPINAATLLLWLGPFMMLALLVLLVWRRFTSEEQ